jgi:RNA polymerase sigma-70 factor (ECF subfamily)
MAEGPANGLALIDAIEQGGDLGEHHLLPAARADLLAKLGRKEEACAAYEPFSAGQGAAPRAYLRACVRSGSQERAPPMFSS